MLVLLCHLLTSLVLNLSQISWKKFIWLHYCWLEMQTLAWFILIGSIPMVYRVFVWLCTYKMAYCFENIYRCRIKTPKYMYIVYLFPREGLRGCSLTLLNTLSPPPKDGKFMRSLCAWVKNVRCFFRFLVFLYNSKVNPPLVLYI